MRTFATTLQVILIAGVLAFGCGPKASQVQTTPDNYLRPHTIQFELEQTRTTEPIRQTAEELRGDNDLATVANFRRWVRQNTIRGGRRFFLQRNADLLFQDRNLSGCIDIATLFAAFTRSVGIPTVFVHGVDSVWAQRMRFQDSGKIEEYKGHTFLELYLDDAWYLVDPTEGVLYQAYDSNNPNLPRNFVVQYKGNDMWGFGVKSRKDLYKAMTRFVKGWEKRQYSSPHYPSVNLDDSSAMECYVALKHAAEGASVAFPQRCKDAGLSLKLDGLLPVSPGFYEIIAHHGEVQESLGRFDIKDGNTVDLQGQPIAHFPLPTPLGDCSALSVVVHLEEKGPSHTLLAGTFHLGASSLLLSHHRAVGQPLNSVKGTLRLRIGKGKTGLWWTNEDPDKLNAVCSAEVPSLPDGWRYETWILAEKNGMPVQESLGRFQRSTGGDDSPQKSSRRIQCPGQWFPTPDSPIPTAKGKTTSEETVLLTLEPNPDSSPDPFFLTLLEGKIKVGSKDGAKIEMRPTTATLPKAQINIVW